MHIAVLCATARGRRFLQRLTELAPDDRFTVVSFREQPHEPPFLDDIRGLATARGATIVEYRPEERTDLSTLWKAEPVDLLFAVSWRYMVPPHVYERVTRGAFVLHDSLLPQNRGFAPTVWAVVNGETTTGATLFEMAEEADAGAIVDQEAVPIGPDDTIADVMEDVTDAYLRLLDRNLSKLRAGTAVSTPQDETRATLTDRFRPEDALIDWSWPMDRIHNLIRGYTRPYPGAFTQLGDRKLVVWEASPGAIPAAGPDPGRVRGVLEDGGVVVGTGDGDLFVHRVEIEGSGPVAAADALRPGTTLGS